MKLLREAREQNVQRQKQTAATVEFNTEFWLAAHLIN